MAKPRCLIITPFDAQGQRVFEAVSRTLQESGVEVLYPHGSQARWEWLNRALELIRQADLLVVDISRDNPNVYYELGFAHALRKPTVLISSVERESPLPAQLAGFHFIVYEPDNFRRLVDHLEHVTRGLARSREEST